MNFVVTFQGIFNLANFLTSWDRWKGVGKINNVKWNRTRLLRRSLKLKLKGKRPMG
jgi:hypothetical protein